MELEFAGFIEGETIKVRGLITESSLGTASNGSKYARGVLFTGTSYINWIGFDRRTAPGLGATVTISGKYALYKGIGQIQVSSIEDVISIDAMPMNKKLISYYRNCVEKEFQGSIIKADLSKLPNINSQEQGLIESMNHTTTVELSYKSSDFSWFKKVSLAGLDSIIMLGFPILKKIKSDGSKKYAPLAYIECNLKLDNNSVTLIRISDAVLWNYGALELLGVPLEERDYIKDRLDSVTEEYSSDTERLSAGISIIENYINKNLAWDDRFSKIKQSIDYNLEIIYSKEVCFDGQPNSVYEYLLKDLGELLNKPAVELNKGPLSMILSNAQNKVDATDYRVFSPLPTNKEQNGAILNGLKSTLSCVTGPPGTGKSQFVANLASSAVANGMTVLISSKNNQAVDVAISRLKNAIPKSWPIRCGNKENKTLASTRLYEAVKSNHSYADLNEINNNYDDIILKYNNVKYLRDNYHSILDEKTAQVKSTVNKIKLLASELEAFPQDLTSDLIKILDSLNLVLLKPLKLFRKNKQINKRKLHSLTILSEIESRHNIPSLSKIWKNSVRNITKTNLDVLGECYLFLYKLNDEHIKFRELVNYSSKLNSELIAIKPYLEVEEEVLELEIRIIELSKEIVEQSWDNLASTTADIKILETLAMSLGSGYVSNLKNQVIKSLNVSPIWAITNLSAYNNLPLESGMFDLVIIDEASQCDIASVLPLLFRAKKAILVGDPNQLQHITSIKVKDSNLLGLSLGLKDLSSDFLNYTENSAFALCRSKTETSVVLREHYRSHPAIAEFANKFVYNGELDVLTSPVLYQKGDGIFWHDLVGVSETNWEGQSLRNLDEARMVIKLLVDITTNKISSSIGVVTPFKEQAELIIKEISKLPDFNNLDIRVATAHKFQGDERDIIILSTVITDGTQVFKKEFANNLNLINVSVTRARRQLHIVGNRELCYDFGGILGGLASYCDALQKSGFESPAEESFYNLIDKTKYSINTQEVIGSYRVDFLLRKNNSDINLVVECDGHPFHRDLVRDSVRDGFLRANGYKVAHIPARDCLKYPDKVITIVDSFFKT